MAFIKPLTAINGIIPKHAKDILQEKKNPKIIPTTTALRAYKTDANPSVETPLIIYASVDRVEVKTDGEFSLISNHPKCFSIIFE